MGRDGGVRGRWTVARLAAEREVRRRDAAVHDSMPGDRERLSRLMMIQIGSGGFDRGRMRGGAAAIGRAQRAMRTAATMARSRPVQRARKTAMWARGDSAEHHGHREHRDCGLSQHHRHAA